MIRIFCMAIGSGECGWRFQKRTPDGVRPERMVTGAAGGRLRARPRAAGLDPIEVPWELVPSSNSHGQPEFPADFAIAGISDS
jgi:hypothetical protein